MALIPARTKKTLGLVFDGIEASDYASRAHDVGFDRGPAPEIRRCFDAIADPIRGVEPIFDPDTGKRQNSPFGV